MYTFNIRRLYCVTNTKIYSPKCLLFGYNNVTNENLINRNIDHSLKSIKKKEIRLITVF